MTILKKVSSLEKSVVQINLKISNTADDPKPGLNIKARKAVLKRKNSNSDSVIANFNRTFRDLVSHCGAS